MSIFLEGDWVRVAGGSYRYAAYNIQKLQPATVSILNGGSGLVSVDFTVNRSRALSDYLYNIYKFGLISEAEYTKARIDILGNIR